MDLPALKIAKVFAPAKINLTLHVTGQRKDGFHLLDSLVVFADVGDRISVRLAEANKLDVIGPKAAGVPTDGSNLVCKAADLIGLPVHITLSKHLPNAAGIGGGSSDAAATLLALAELSEDSRLPDVSELGADVRVCLMRQSARMRGIGEEVNPIEGMPPLFAVLANPGIDVPTPTVFKALARKNNAPMPSKLPRWKSTKTLIDWLATQRNDLEAPAITCAPEIAITLAALDALPGAKLTRMSGSGATCFALFDTRAAAETAAKTLRDRQANWWIAPCSLS